MARTKREVVTEFRCSEILQSARRVFAEKGFAEATVDEIAEAAGMAKGTIYLYFRSKSEIYLAALKEDMTRLHEETARRMEAARSLKESIRAFIDTRIEYADQHRDFCTIYHSEITNVLCNPAHVPADLKELYERQYQLLKGLLDRGIARGEIRGSRSDLMASAIYDVTRGLIARRLLGSAASPSKADGDAIFDMVWKGMGVR